MKKSNTNVTETDHYIKTFIDSSLKDNTMLCEINPFKRLITFSTEIDDFEMDKIIRYAEMLEYMDDKKDITVIINSGGGNVTSSLKYYDAIRRLKCKVNTIVEGICMSAATVMSIGTTGKRFITPHSSMMFHQMTTFSIGKVTDEKNRLDWATELQDKIIDIYIKYTNIKSKKEWKQILSTDSFFHADDCIKNGFVDGFLK